MTELTRRSRAGESGRQSGLVVIAWTLCATSSSPAPTLTVVLIQAAAASLLLLAILNLVACLVAWGFERNPGVAIRLR